MNWYYKGEELTENYIPPVGVVGFVYKIIKVKECFINVSYIDGFSKWDFAEKLYIGKKLLANTTKRKVGKREAAKQLLETGDKRKVKKVIRGSKISNWVQYNSSCKPLQEEIRATPELFRKEIIRFCFTKKELSYYELKMQFAHDVLEVDSYNDNIAGTYYRKDLNNGNTERN